MRTASGLRSIVLVLVASLAASISPVAAQSSSPPPDGITVIGYGQASGPADTATLELIVSSMDFSMPMSMMPQPGATPGAAEREQVAPLVDALIASGLGEEDIEVIVPPYLGNVFAPMGGPTVALIQVSVQDPSTDRITQIIDMASSVANEQQLMVGAVNVTFTVEDCTDLKTEAREAAFDDAVVNAGIQGGVTGVSPGDVLASRDAPYSAGYSPFGGISADGSCTTVFRSDVGGPAGPETFAPGDPTDVIVYATTEVTFEISADPGATPAG